MFMNVNKKELFYDLSLVVLGNIILAIGVGFFVLPSNILSGGVAGVAVALSPFIHVEASLLINIITIGLFLLGAVCLGKKFALSTVISSVLYPTLLTFITANFDVYVTESPILASIYTGVCIGVGVGLVFRAGASSGGMDIPPLIINKYTGLSLPTLVLITDGLTVCLGILAYGVEAALVGLISVYLSSIMLNKVLTIGGHDAKNVMIISEKHKEIISAIYTEINRGATILEASGGYKNEKRPVVMVVVAKKQYPVLNKLVTHIDPKAFMVVTDTTEVQGLGFSYQEEM